MQHSRNLVNLHATPEASHRNVAKGRHAPRLLHAFPCLVVSTLSLAFIPSVWSAFIDFVCRAIALDAQLSLGQQYSNGVVAVLLSLGAILEILFYKVIFSATNFIAWLFCTDKPVSQSPLAGIVKDLFSGVGPLYILAMIGWAAFLTSIALLSALRVGGVAMSDILTVLMLERVHTWSWQFMCVAAITFIAGRRREAFERLAARKAAAMVIAPPDDVNPSTDADTSVDEESAQLVKGSGQQRVSGALALAAKGFDDSLNWEELQWWRTHDFVPPQPQQSLSVRLRAWVQDVLRVHQQQPSASPV